jgi:cell division protease FtsH
MLRKSSGPAPRKAKPPRAPQRKNTPFGPARPIRTALLWLILVLGVILFVQIYGEIKAKTHEIPYSEFLAQVDSGNMKAVTIVDREVVGELKTSALTHEEGRPASYVFFKVYLPAEDKDLGRAILAKSPDATVNSKPPGMNWWSLALSYLPFVALLVLWMFMIRQIQSGGANAMKFGKSRPKVLMENSPKVTFKDVAGADEAKQELEEIIEFLRDPKKFQRLGGRIPKGALLLGPPGTGKTLLAKAVAGEANVPFFSLSGSDFVEMFVGVGASRVRDLFDQGKRNAPCIIFIDEIDAVGRHRGAGLGGGHDEREQTLNQLLVEMDGFETNEGVILIAATNRPDVLDPALLRPGRFDRRVLVDRPELDARLSILGVHTRHMPLAPDVELNAIARDTPGFSGADLANLANEAALGATRRGSDAVTAEDFSGAFDKIVLGDPRDAKLSPTEKQRVAVHESGHAVVAHFAEHAELPQRVSIIPRGMALGATQQSSSGDRHIMTQAELEARLLVLMGGYAAERIVLEDVSTGAENDLKEATRLATKMVANFGMSKRMGAVYYEHQDEHPFLGQRIATDGGTSDSTAAALEDEARAFLTKALAGSRGLIESHREVLDRLVHALLEKETIEKAELADLLNGKRQANEVAPAVERPIHP